MARVRLHRVELQDPRAFGVAQFPDRATEVSQPAEASATDDSAVDGDAPPGDATEADAPTVDSPFILPPVSPCSSALRAASSVRSIGVA